jgi:FkbM family methyltransferase
MELGWEGVCIEPHPKICEKLEKNCKQFDKVWCFEIAIGKENGILKLNANPTYYSTLINSEMDRWKDTNFKFKPVKVEVMDFKTFYEVSPLKKFDFISIDCEGLDFDVLTQIDLDLLECSMVCVETNGKETDKYINYISKFSGFRVVHVNLENLIMAR